jgi:hypothetical protein
VSPLGPVSPFGPASPLGPCGPESPFGPAWPCDPGAPAEPLPPAWPVAPAVPAAPCWFQEIAVSPALQCCLARRIRSAPVFLFTQALIGSLVGACCATA